MAFPILGAISAGTALYSALGGGQKRKRFDAKAARRINDRYMGARPGGYLTAEDTAQVGRVRARGVATARRSGALSRDAAALGARRRGLYGASAAALQTLAGQTEAAGRQQAADIASDTEYGLYGGNRDFEREKLFKAWGSELGAEAGDAARSAQQESGLWNSIIGSAPLIADMWSNVPVKPSATALGSYAEGAGGYYNPSVTRRF